MKWRKDKAICGPNGWHLKCLGYNASHTATIQELIKFILAKFDDLAFQVVPAISTHERFTYEPFISSFKVKL
jgi:hypothetical protein